MQRAAGVSLALSLVLVLAACVTPGAPATPTATPLPTPIPAVELDLPRCQGLKAPRATPDAAGRLPTALDAPFRDCAWTEALSQVSVPEYWESQRDRGGGSGGGSSSLSLLPKDDPGVRQVTVLAGGVPPDLRGRDFSLRGEAIFQFFFQGRATDSRNRRGQRYTVAVSTGPTSGTEQGIDGPATGIAMGFSDGFQLFILSAVTRTEDARRVEDLMFKLADSITPHYSRQ